MLEPGAAEVPWPSDLAWATAVLIERQIGAVLVDSIAVRESAAGYLQRLRDLLYDRVAVATSPESLADDWPLLTAAGRLACLVLLWPGPAAQAEGLLAIEGVSAVVCGEPEAGLALAIEQQREGVVLADPVADPDALPSPYRDYTVTRYGHPRAGLPCGPALVIRASLGPDRWRSVDSTLTEIAACRYDHPRLMHLFVADPGLNRDPDRFAALAEALGGLALPWAARLTTAAPIPESAATAAALEVRCDGPLSEGTRAALRRLSSRVALTLLVDDDPDTLAQATEVGARELRPVPRPHAWTSPAEAGAVTCSGRRVFIVGMHVPHYMPPWLRDGAAEAGYEAVAVDVFEDPRQVRLLLDSRPDDVAIFDRGNAFPPDLIGRIPARTVLYYPDVLPTSDRHQGVAVAKYAEFRAVAPHFDDVVLHDRHAYDWLLSRGHANLRGVVMLPYDPKRHRDLGLDRDLEVLFVGGASDHRERWIEHLRAAGIPVTWEAVWGEEFIHAMNRAKVVLNLHFTEHPNTELRIVEALACRCFVVSEPVTAPPLFEDGVHFVALDWDTAAQTIRHYLARPAERERIAAAGQAYVAERFTARHCVQDILALLPERP